MIARFGRWALPLALGALLSGCVGGLLGGGKPDQLYRFGGAQTATASGDAPFRPRRVELLPPRFAPEVAGDRILTTGGRSAAYVQDARWSTAAPALYAAALTATFVDRSTDIAVVERRDARGEGLALLRIEVTRFEAQYPGEATEEGVAPTVLVQGEAALIEAESNRVLGTYRFVEREAAGADRVSAIVGAFDAAVARSVGGTVDWTTRTLPRTAPGR